MTPFRIRSGQAVGALGLAVASLLSLPTMSVAQPASAETPAAVVAAVATRQAPALPAARKPKRPGDGPSRSLPRAGGPVASQAYARAFIAQRYGWGSGQFSCLKVMWTRESAWRYWASNPNGRYHGIPQTSSAVWSKYGYTTSQYMRSPEVQVRVGAAYIKSRYGSPCAAWSFWQRHHWY